MPKKKAAVPEKNFGEMVQDIQDNYVNNATKRQRLIDGYLSFVVLATILQVVYCQISGAYPFNAFLGSLFTSVGIFALALVMRANDDDRDRPISLLESAFCGAALFVVGFIYMY
jgi:hypothetical protein